MKTLVLSALLALPVTLATASAQITVDSTLNVLIGVGNPGAAGEQIVASFDASASDKLVVVVSTEHAFGTNAALSIDGMEYNGQAMIEAVEEDTLPGTTALYYLDSPGAAGEIRLFTGNKNGGRATVYALSGTAPGVAATAQSTADSVPITTTSANSLVIAGILDGGQAANGNGAGAPTALPPLTNVHSGTWGNSWGGHSSGYELVAAAGAVNPTFSTAGLVRLRTVAAAFGADGTSSITVVCDPANDHTQGSYTKLDNSSIGPGGGILSGLHLEATDGPIGEFGYFLVSASASGSAAVSNGILCLVTPQGRYSPSAGVAALNSLGSFDGNGTYQSTIQSQQGWDVPSGLPTPPGGTITAGDTWYFQMWYRDGQRSNFSNAIRVTF